MKYNPWDERIKPFLILKIAFDEVKVKCIDFLQWKIVRAFYIKYKWKALILFTLFYFLKELVFFNRAVDKILFISLKKKVTLFYFPPNCFI